MQRNTLHILWFVLLMGIVSVLYFFSLLLHVPVWLTALAVVPAGILSLRWLSDLTVDEIPIGKTHTTLSYIALAAGLFLLVNRGFYFTEKYGGWDAWAIWNSHAMYLKDPVYWKNYITAHADLHPDYPLCLSAIVAFTWRLLHTTSYLVPAAISAIISIAIPASLFLIFYRKNLLVAALLLVWFATDDFYIGRSLSQYADHLLALFFLCSFICMDYFRQSNNVKSIALAGAFLALMAWTKNEGMMLALVFAVFQLDHFVKRKLLFYFLSCALLPLIALGIFKGFYAPENDLVRLSGDIVPMLTDTDRIRTILDVLRLTVKKYYLYYEYAALLLLLACLVRRTWPHRNFFIILTCLLAYLVVYLVTPHDLQWHLNTSLDRVLAQLAPALAYTIGIQLSAIKLPFSKKHAL